ncbi:peptidase C14 [Eremomyces bilateralis CBS 781.70]|uniref:Peptidase C14 n=1 Tax=Eremomyces bilateralis CBS 781.70 TaxID=1392243 RepID=A0A6G1GCK7_9PEZI|nr:peptidase C14 [Eremomyces bilateralis CBS 781.70]KAF1815631.1 peptidase C14 [Eremomyces bilateralis CBS 781.70]
MVRKALLIGINYTGTNHALRGCHQDVRNMIEFLEYHGFHQDDMVVLMDQEGTDPHGSSWPTGQNIQRAIQWLIHTPNASLFMHYSGHGGNIPDPDGTGTNATICPVDFEQHGQIDSDTLHQTLVTPLPPSSQIHAIFDCCHSGSVLELSHVYRLDESGHVLLLDNIKTGLRLASSAAGLLQGGFTREKVRDAQELLGGAKSFFSSFSRLGSGNADGLDEEANSDYPEEARQAILYSGCRDDQTSADASIAGAATGAMSWAFLKVMREFDGQQSYVDILRNTRELLVQNYSQVPQLSCAGEIDLDSSFQL